jgi:hypothetical protein
MQIQPLIFKGLAYDVKEIDVGHPGHKPLINAHGAVIVDKPPVFLLLGKSGARYGLFPTCCVDDKFGTVLRAYNLNDGQNYWAHPFGKRGFTLQGDKLVDNWRFRSKPTRRRQVRRIRPVLMLPVRV